MSYRLRKHYIISLTVYAMRLLYKQENDIASVETVSVVDDVISIRVIMFSLCLKTRVIIFYHVLVQDLIKLND